MGFLSDYDRTKSVEIEFISSAANDLVMWFTCKTKQSPTGMI